MRTPSANAVSSPLASVYDAHVLVDLAHVHRDLCLGHVVPPISNYLSHALVLAAQGVERAWQPASFARRGAHFTAVPFRALASSGKTPIKSERRVSFEKSS